MSVNDRYECDKNGKIYNVDYVNSNINPSHYKSHPSGVEAITITEHMGFCLGNVMKYVWRADLKHDDCGLEDITKALWYLKRELNLRHEERRRRDSSN